VSDRRRHQRCRFRRLDAGDHRGVRRGIRWLSLVQQKLPGVAAGTEFQSQLDEGVVLRARPAADAGGRERTARLVIVVRKSAIELLPLEVRAAATRDAALPGAAQRGERRARKERQRLALALSARPSLLALRLSVPAALLLRPALPVEVERCDGVMEQALRER
jgi:hypothetical protein